MSFDQTSAVAVNNEAVNTTSFDINSAKDEPQLQASTDSAPVERNQTGEVTNDAQAPSPISRFVRGIVKFMGGGLEQFNEDKYTYEHAKDFPTQIQGENSDSYNNRIQEFYKPYESQNIAGGVMKQLDAPMQMALVAALPEMSLTHLGQLGGFIGLDQVRSTVQNIVAPDASPTLKDVMDLGGFAGEAKLVGVTSDGLKDFISNSLLSQGKSPTVDIAPEEVNKIINSDNLTTEEKKGTFTTLGITPDHINASLSSNLPIRVPINNLLDLTQQTYGDRIQEELSTENIPSPKQEDVQSPASEQGTSKIAQSINQKAIEDKLTTGFSDLASYDKVNFKEQSEKVSNIIGDDFENALSIIRGDTALPQGVKGISMIAGMEEHLKNHPNPDVAYELANSPLVRGTSEAAQEVSLARMRTQDSFTAKMAELKKAKIDALGGEEIYAKTKKSLVKSLKSETDKMSLSEDELGSLDKFFNDIGC